MFIKQKIILMKSQIFKGILKKFLFLHTFYHFSIIPKTFIGGDGEGGEWSDNWGDWEDKSEDTDSVLNQQNTNLLTSWLTECKVSISPTADYFVIAHKNRIVILSSKLKAYIKLILFI